MPRLRGCSQAVAQLFTHPTYSPGLRSSFSAQDQSPDKNADKQAKEKHACKGQNSCKGKGGCKSSDNGCKGKNSCKGKGGCATDGSKMPDNPSSSGKDDRARRLLPTGRAGKVEPAHPSRSERGFLDARESLQ